MASPEYDRWETALLQAEEGMSYSLSAHGAAAVRELVAMGIDPSILGRVIDVVEKLEHRLATEDL